MKHKWIMFAATLCLIIMMAGCGNANENTETTTEQQNQQSTQEQTSSGDTASQPEDGAAGSVGEVSYKVGLGVVSHMDNSRNAEDDMAGNVRIDSTVAAVVVGEDNVIIGCHLDGMKHQVEFSEEGHISTPLDTELKTKNELGDEYGMKAASGIGREWYEQARAFERYVVGMTPEEVSGIPVDEDGMMSAADAVASVTISISDFQKAIQKAVENAR